MGFVIVCVTVIKAIGNKGPGWGKAIVSSQCPARSGEDSEQLTPFSIATAITVQELGKALKNIYSDVVTQIVKC